MASRHWAKLLSLRPKVAVLGSCLVLVCAFIAELLNPETAGLAVAAASWGFLTFAHWSRRSTAPVWRGLLVFAPFLLLATLYLTGLGSASPRFAELKHVGALSGLVALGTALHLTVTRRSTLRQVLLGCCALSILHVGITITTILISSDSTGLMTHAQAHPEIIALSILAWSLGLGLLGESERYKLWLGFAWLPLAFALSLSPNGWLLTALISAVALARRFSGIAWHQWRWWLPAIAVITILIASSRTWWTSSTEFWQAYWAAPLFGQGVATEATVTSGWMNALQQYGLVGLLLLAITPVLYLKSSHRRRRHEVASVDLRDWCWIGCGLMAVLAVWESPFDHHGVATLTIILFVSGQIRHRGTASSCRSRTAEPVDLATANRLVSAPQSNEPEPRKAVLASDIKELATPVLRPSLAHRVIYPESEPRRPLAIQKSSDHHRPRIWHAHLAQGKQAYSAFDGTLPKVLGNSSR